MATENISSHMFYSAGAVVIELEIFFRSDIIFSFWKSTWNKYISLFVSNLLLKNRLTFCKQLAQLWVCDALDVKPMQALLIPLMSVIATVPKWQKGRYSPSRAILLSQENLELRVYRKK